MYSMVTVGTKEKGQFKTSDHLKIDRLGLSVPVLNDSCNTVNGS
jgi:hypothetical protein